MLKKHFENLLIEPTNICNLHCPICPTGGKYDKRPKGFMNFKRFKRILDPLKNSLRFLQLSGYGEPFLAPDIIKMIDYAGENSIPLSIFTNGTILNKKTAEHFKRNHRIDITFSIDGVNQKSYGYYRVGGRFKNVLNNLSRLADLKRALNLFNVQIIWQFLIMRTNEHEIEKAYELAEKIGVDKLRLKTISIYEQHSRYNDFSPLNKKFRRLKSETKECHFISPGTPFVFWNGDVVPCCAAYRKENIMGNAFQNGLAEIWNNKKYTEFRKEYESGKNFLCNQRCRYAVNSTYVKDFNFKPGDR